MFVLSNRRFGTSEDGSYTLYRNVGQQLTKQAALTSQTSEGLTPWGFLTKTVYECTVLLCVLHVLWISSLFHCPNIIRIIRMAMDPPRLDARQDGRIFLRCMSKPMNLGAHSAQTGVKRPKHEADHSTTHRFEVKNTRRLNVPTKRQSYFHVPLLKGHGNHYNVCYTL